MPSRPLGPAEPARSPEPAPGARQRPAAPPRLPIVTPGLRRLWRAGDTLQLGVAAERAVLLPGLGQEHGRALDLLDGRRGWLDLLEDAPPGSPAHQVITALDATRCLDDAAGSVFSPEPVRPGHGRPAPPARARPGPEAAGAADPSATSDLARARLAADHAALALRAPRAGGAADCLARRAVARVVVHGGGRVGATVAALLAAAGVGQVRVVDAAAARPEDLAPGGLPVTALGTPRGPAAERSLAGHRTATMPVDERRHRRPPRRTAQPPAVGRSGGARAGPGLAGLAGVDPSGVDLSAADVAGVDLAVLATPGPGDAFPAERHLLQRHGVAHLALGVREVTGIVGPLVVPGHTACLDCLERHRADRDPAWPLLAAQLRTTPEGFVDACDISLATLVAATGALQALARLDGEAPATLGGTLEVTLPDWRLRRRSWTPHPDCECGAG